MGDRPTEFARALASLQAQRGVDLEIVLVGNGFAIPPTEGATVINLPENVGCPEGRNVGAADVAADYLFFYDDDADLPDHDTVLRLAEVLAGHPEVAAVQARPADPFGRPAPERWTPREAARRGVEVSGPVVWLWEGVCMMRRDVFQKVGGWAGHFFFAHEGVDLMWRIWDAGYVGWYAADAVVHHPATSAKRHSIYFRTNARNRVWVAVRNLPASLVAPYLAIWVAMTLRREWRNPRGLAAWFGGFAEGLRGGWGERRPMSWRTVWRMTRAGRPPLF